MLPIYLYKFFHQLKIIDFITYFLQPINLLKYHGLRFIISSLEKKGHSFIAQNSSTSDQLRHSAEPAPTLELEADETWKETGAWFSTSVAYLLSFTERISPFLPRKMKNCEDSSNAVSSNEHEPTVRSSEFTSFLALKDSVTAIVDGKELLNAAELNSVCSSSSPCEWFICDDDRSGTRYFVIQVKLLFIFIFIFIFNFGYFQMELIWDFSFQGSESLASWQVNLLFEPIQFEVINGNWLKNFQKSKSLIIIYLYIKDKKVSLCYYFTSQHNFLNTKIIFLKQ